MATTNLVYKGLKANLPGERGDAFYLCTDTKELYFGSDLYTDPVRFYTEEKPETPAQGVLYIDEETGAAEVWNGSAWKPILKGYATEIGEVVDDTTVPTTKAVKDYVDKEVEEVIAGDVGVIGALAHKDKVAETDLEEALATKLNKKADVGTDDDTSDLDTIKAAKKYADEKDTALKTDVVGVDGAQAADDTIRGAKAYADEKDAATKAALIGDASDTADKDTIKGAKKYTDDQIAAKVSSTYKAGGTKAFEDLTDLLTEENEGTVYNISDKFTTDDSFVEGTGKEYPAGTNVVCIDAGESDYKWDVLAGFVDLSGYDTAETAAGKVATAVSDAKEELIGTGEGVTAETIKAAVTESKGYTDDKNGALDTRVTAVETAITIGTF